MQRISRQTFWLGDDPGIEQRALFDAQLRLARDFDLPLILHARRAVDEVILRLRRIGGLRGVVHSFSGSIEQARQLFQLGFHLGIGGPVTYERAQRLRGLVATMPIEFLLLESDAPDQPNASARGARNEPVAIVDVAQTIAGLRGVDVTDIATATTANAIRLFRLAAHRPWRHETLGFLLDHDGRGGTIYVVAGDAGTDDLIGVVAYLCAEAQRVGPPPQQQRARPDRSDREHHHRRGQPLVSG
mgnify:CR=1 FL=1